MAPEPRPREFWQIRRLIIQAAPVKVWARRLGVHRVTMSRCLSMEPQLFRLRQQLIEAFESLERGEWHFIPPDCYDGRSNKGRKSASAWSWTGETPSERERRRNTSPSVRLTDEGVSLVLHAGSHDP